MSLERFRRTRLVILRPTASAYEAARAMADNHVGAVLVAEGHRVVGIVTDRDLALRVVGRDLDARAVHLPAIMTNVVATCDAAGGIGDVVAAMKQRACRRVPVVDKGKPVGLVTLDDLIVDAAVAADELRAIVEAQLQGDSRLKPEGRLRPGPRRATTQRTRLARHAARADTAYRKLVRAVEMRTSPRLAAKIEPAIELVLGEICERLRPEDARRLVAQLPSKLREALEPRVDVRRKDGDPSSIERALHDELGVSEAAAASLLDAVCDAIADEVSPGGIRRLKQHLPARLRALFAADSARAET